MKSDSRALRIAIAFALPCVALLCAHALFDPVYRTSDDPTMLLIAAGEAYADQPSPYLIFSNHVWGTVLAFFYAWVPAVPWYGLFQLVVQLGANATLVYVALGKRISVGRLMAIAGYLLVFDMLMSARPHFTLTASIAGIAAIVLLWDRFSGPDGLGPARWTMFVVLWATSAAIRHESAVLVYLLSAPPALVPLVQAWRSGGMRQAMRKVAAPMLVAAGIVASFHGYNLVRYHTPDWREFIETGPSIGSILDFSSTGSTRMQTWQRFPDGATRLHEVRHPPEVYRAAADGPGWTENELHMLMEWFYADAELYSLDQIERFLKRIGKPPPDGSAPFAPLRSDPNLYLLVAALVVGWSSRRFDPRDAVQLGLLALAALGITAYVDFGLHRLVSWVYEPIFAMLGWSILAVGRERPLVSSDLVWFVTRALAMGLLLAFLLPAGVRIAGESATTTAHREVFMESVRDLNANVEHLYVSWATSFPLELLGPFDDLEPFRDLNVYSAGAATNGGHNRRLLRRFGITDIYQAIYRILESA